ncbi:MAG: penicillin acylase family protein [Pseudomonadota bacterium]
MIKILKITFSIIFVALLGAAIWLYDPLPENPEASVLLATAKGYQANVVRDEWGVPHISGERDADASFGLAYVHAEDDYETIQEVVAATRGQLAHYRGADAAPTDYIVSLLGVWETVNGRYEAEVPADVKAIAAGYAAGLNLYASRHPAQTWRGLAPFKAEDVVAGFIFKTPFFYGLDGTLLELFDETRDKEIALDPNAKSGAFSVREKSSARLGSNAMAIAAKRSDDNVTRLLINSHQPMTGPVAWYEAHLKSDQGLDIMGGIFPGTPVILHGFNQHLGWANTVSNPDLVDVYVLDRNPDNPAEYRLDGEWHTFKKTNIEIKVKLFGPFTYTATRQLLESAHGPVIEAGDNTYAIRYAGRDEIRQLEQYYRLNQATGFDEFMAAMGMNALPSINYVYADKDDNIAFIHNGQYPDRALKWDWQQDLPGDRSDLIWQSYLPFSDVPKLVNPNSGLLFNANNTPMSATDGDDNLLRESFPATMGLQTNQTNRAHRLVELNDGKSPISKQGLLDQKFDVTYSLNSNQHKIVQTLMAADWSHDPRLEAAAEFLEGWDYRADLDNRHAALPALVFGQLRQSSNPEDYALEALTEPFEKSVALLHRKFGRIDPLWREVNRLKRGSFDEPVAGGPDVLRAIYSVGLEDDQTYATHGDTWMALVEWQDGKLLNADLLHQFGSATLDDQSPHYADQAQLFVDQGWRQAEFSIDELSPSREYKVSADTVEN